MKSLIYIYTNTGNTRLACEYIAKQTPEIEWEFCDVKTCEKKDHADYDLIGFACYTDAWDVPKYFKEYIEKINKGNGKYAFVFNTYGATSGRTLKNLANVVTKKGFKVLGGHSLHTPENYPPMIAIGPANAKAPSKKAFKKFEIFIENLKNNIEKIIKGKMGEIKVKEVDIGLNNLLPTYPHFMIDKVMGKKKVDKEKCKQCGLCERNCPYGAIKLDPYPVFDNSKCSYCWSCYNLCPQKAISTTYFKKSRYSCANQQLRDKLK